jgi:hypothetical protein
MTAMEILHTYHIHHYTHHSDDIHAGNGNGGHDSADIPDFISQEDFIAICPSIIYQLDGRICQPDQTELQVPMTSSSPCRGDVVGGRRRCAEVEEGSSSSSDELEVNGTAPTIYDGEPMMVFGVPAKSRWMIYPS